MMWDFKFDRSGVPLYLQIANALEQDILSGEILPGHRLMSHRELAQITGVTVSTATRAYAEAENRGLIKTEAGKGTFVTDASPSVMPDTGTGAAIEMGVSMPLFLDEPSIRPVLLKVAQDENVDALVKCFAPTGFARHREIAAAWLSRSGVNVTADSLLMAAGHPHGLFSIFYSVFERADKIAVCQLTNPILIALAARAGFDLMGVEMDEDGMLPEKLEALCRAENIKGIYIAPGVNNMSTKPMLPGRGEALAEVIKRHNLILIEDGSYAAPEIGRRAPMAALLPENSICLLSFSSVLFSALRVAFIHTPPRFCERLTRTIVANMWTVAPLCVALACECIENGMADRAVKQKRKEVARRVGVLREMLSDFDVSCSEDAIFAWLHLPESWTSQDFEFLAKKSGVNVFAADRLAVAGTPPLNYIRLSITGPPDMATFKKGLEILAGLLKREGDAVGPLW